MTNTRSFRPLLLLSLYVGLSRCSVMQKLRHLCPNSNFCTGNRSMADGLRTGSITCCRECHCDETCYEYDDCCPDVGSVKLQRNNTRKLQCTTAIARNTSFISEVKSPNILPYLRRYRIVNFCPKDYQDNSIVEKCILGSQNAKEYDDVTVVSDVNDRIFQNKYCALCHGSSDVVPWQLKILTCKDYLNELRLKASEMKDYILNSCLLESLAPDTLAYSSRLFSCRDFRVSRCDNHPDKDVRDGCNYGPYMPYLDMYMDAIHALYKNVFCYLCEKMVEGPVLCLDEDDINRSYSTGISRLLNLHDNVAEKKPNSVCGEDETWNYFKKRCTALLCPPYEAVSYGQCRPIFKPSSVNIRLRLIFFLSNSVVIPGSINTYNESVEKHYLRRLAGFYKDANCSLLSLFIMALRKVDTAEVFAVEVEMNLKLLDDQSFDVLTDSLRERSSWAEVWLVNNMVVKTKGKLDVYESRYRDDKTVDFSSLFTLASVKVTEPVLQRFFLCPYLALNPQEYRAIINKLAGANGTNDKPSTFSLLTETPSGFFVLSKTRVAVCIDTYQRIYNTASGLHVFEFLLAFMILYVLCIK